LNIFGAIARTSSSIFCASMRSSHCECVHKRSSKKLYSERAFIVIIIFVSHAFGSTNRASSFGAPAEKSSYGTDCINSMNFFANSGLPLMLGGIMNEKSDLSTYRWLCCEYEAMRCRTSWCVSAREMPSTPNVKLACSITDMCPARKQASSERWTSCGVAPRMASSMSIFL